MRQVSVIGSYIIVVVATLRLLTFPKTTFVSFRFHGNHSIDKMLNGGVLTGEVVEVTGPPSSGKTQVSGRYHKMMRS